jgi:DNA uptake protein ComE-like DNA-binding protein
MTPPSPHSTGEGTRSGPERAWLTVAAAVLALGLLAASRPAAPADPPAPAPDLVVDPNTAPPEVLGALPKVGPVLLHHLRAARAERPFDSLDDLDRRVRRVGPATLAALRPHLRIEPIPTPPLAASERAN